MSSAKPKSFAFSGLMACAFSAHNASANAECDTKWNGPMQQARADLSRTKNNRQDSKTMKINTRAFQYDRYGGPGVLSYAEVPLPAPEKGEVQLRHTAIGVNFLDVYQRSGADQSQALPARIGVEGVARISATHGPHARFAVGDRVAYVGGPPGAYALKRNFNEDRLIKLPDWIEDDFAAALMFKCLTAEYLINRCVAVQKGQSVLFHAAAGGVGSVACQWLHAKGVKIVGVVGSEGKVAQARQNGCDHVLLADDPDFVTKVRSLTNGVDVAYDSVGKATFMNTLDCLRPRGTMVSFGAASGPAPEINVSDLVSRGSLFLTRPSIAHYIADTGEYQQSAERLFQAVSDGMIKPPKFEKIPLANARAAHEMLESRNTTGSLVLVPDA